MKNKILIFTLLVVFASMFVLCDIIPQVTYPTDSLPEDFQSYDPGSTPEDPWVIGVVESSNTEHREPRVMKEEDPGTDQELMILEEVLADTGYGQAETGLSAAQLKFGVETPGTLTFVVDHNGWDAGSKVAPNYVAKFWLNLATEDLEDPPAADWSNDTDQLEDETVTMEITSAGDYLLTWSIQKTDTDYDEDSYYIDDIEFTADEE